MIITEGSKLDVAVVVLDELVGCAVYSLDSIGIILVCIEVVSLVNGAEYGSGASVIVVIDFVGNLNLSIAAESEEEFLRFRSWFQHW